MADESLYDRVHELTDLELAALLSLINREHCLISTPEYALDDLVAELQLVKPPCLSYAHTSINTRNTDCNQNV